MVDKTYHNAIRLAHTLGAYVADSCIFGAISVCSYRFSTADEVDLQRLGSRTGQVGGMRSSAGVFDWGAMSEIATMSSSEVV